MWSQVPSTIGWVPGEPVPGEVVVYFADDPQTALAMAGQQSVDVLAGQPVIAGCRGH